MKEKLMALMEEEKVDEGYSVLSWWSNSHNRPYQSQWLQTTLSDMDIKIKMIIDLIQGDGDSFTERAEMFYERRPELIKLLQDLHKSYLSLAENYDQLIRSDCNRSSGHLRSPCSSLKSHNQNGQPLEEYLKGRVINDYDLKLDGFYKKVKGLNSGEEMNNMELGLSGTVQEAELREEARNELRLAVSKLIEENLKEQAELVKRYDEKRETIRNLHLQVKQLKGENRVLKSYLTLQSHSNVVDMKGSPFHVKKWKVFGCIGRCRTKNFN